VEVRGEEVELLRFGLEVQTWTHSLLGGLAGFYSLDIA
jgi:hypothetical protein